MKKVTGFIEVTIEDNGVGFDASGAGLSYSEKQEGGFGLFSVREQFEYLGGKFDIESETGKGTKVYMALPAGNQNNAGGQK